MHREVAQRLEEPLTLTYRDRRFATIDPELVKVRTNIDELVATAVAESEEGNFLSRSWQDLTGAETGAGHELEVSFSSKAVGRIVEGVRRELDSPMRDAKVSASFNGVNISPSSVGVSVKTKALRQAIAESLVSAEPPARSPSPRGGSSRR